MKSEHLGHAPVTAVPPFFKSPLLGFGQAALAGCMRKKAAQLPWCASILRRKSCKKLAAEKLWKKHKGTQDLKAWAKPLRETVYICLCLIISIYIYSVYAIVCYWELLTSTTVTARCPQSELSLDASRWPKRNRLSGKACQPSRKSLRLRDIARQNTSK